MDIEGKILLFIFLVKCLNKYFVSLRFFYNFLDLKIKNSVRLYVIIVNVSMIWNFNLVSYFYDKNMN